MQLKNPQEALAHYQRAVALAPQVPVSWHQLALCHLALKQPAAADSVLGQALGVVRTEGQARQDLEELREKIRGQMGEGQGR
jgi:tetratricopeptide (TPR) repeat protein